MQHSENKLWDVVEPFRLPTPTDALAKANQQPPADSDGVLHGRTGRQRSAEMPLWLAFGSLDLKPEPFLQDRTEIA